MRESERAAENIRAEMGRQKMSGSELARRLGRSEMWVSRRMNGQADISIDDLAEIAVQLAVPLSALIPDGAAA